MGPSPRPRNLRAAALTRTSPVLVSAMTTPSAIASKARASLAPSGTRESYTSGQVAIKPQWPCGVTSCRMQPHQKIMTTSETELFGPYVVYERLGVGGMATVHRARSKGIEGFERIVALKRLLPHLAEDASFVKSFVREAKLASMLRHANIVQLYELGRVNTTYFISMEYIDGRDIRRILRQARKATGPPTVNVTLS